MVSKVTDERLSELVKIAKNQLFLGSGETSNLADFHTVVALEELQALRASFPQKEDEHAKETPKSEHVTCDVYSPATNPKAGHPDFRPDTEMFVCMDPTGCYFVSWNEADHKARMAKVSDVHEARYVLQSQLEAAERENKRLRSVLAPFADYEVGSIAVVGTPENPPVYYKINVDGRQPEFEHFRAARAALVQP